MGMLETGAIRDNVLAVRTLTVNFFIYKNGDHIICIDSGFRDDVIMRELDKLGVDPRSVTHLFLTHSDFDHAGGVSLFKNAEIYLSADEEPMITGKKVRMYGFMRNSKIKRPYHLLKDDDVITVGPIQVRAIATPGHTPGSMSYLVDNSVLFVGDTFKLIEGKVYPLEHYNMDTERQKESIKKLACLADVSLVCTAHRGYTENFSTAMSDWKQV